MWFLLSIAALLAVSLQSDAAQRCPTFHLSRLNPVFNQTTREWKMAVQYYESGNPLYNCIVKLSTMLTGGAEFEEFSRTTNPEYCSSAAPYLCTMKLPLPTCEGNVVTPVEFKLETTACRQGKRCGGSKVYTLPSFEFLESYTCTEKNTVFKTCGTHKTCKTVSEEKSAGCFCKDGWLWDEIGSKCAEKSASCPGEDEPQAKNLSISVPDCVVDSKPGDDAVFMISWDVDSSREYNFELKDSKGESVLSSDFPRRLSGKQPDENAFYKIDSSRGVITMPNSLLYLGNFTVSITDLAPSPKHNEVASFKVQKGCKMVIPLQIVAQGLCKNGTPAFSISWAVKKNRVYYYVVKMGSTVIRKGTVSGAGEIGFEVSNGRGTIFSIGPLVSGGYTVEVQDLDAGVNAYYTEDASFTVSSCNINLRMFSGCARRGEPISLDVIDAMMTTYQFTIVVESTQVRVLSATATVNQVTGVATTTLNNSASLAVGRYVIKARDKTTLAGGYARFLISDSGIVGGVRYTMDPLPEPPGVFVCVDPEQGKFFPPGLTITFGSNVTSNPSAGYCFWQPYLGNLVEQMITVQPASGPASSASVSYIG